MKILEWFGFGKKKRAEKFRMEIDLQMENERIEREENRLRERNYRGPSSTPAERIHPQSVYYESPRRRDDSADFATSMAVGAATHNALLGGLVGGSIIGGIVGESLTESHESHHGSYADPVDSGCGSSSDASDCGSSDSGSFDSGSSDCGSSFDSGSSDSGSCGGGDF